MACLNRSIFKNALRNARDGSSTANRILSSSRLEHSTICGRYRTLLQHPCSRPLFQASKRVHSVVTASPIQIETRPLCGDKIKTSSEFAIQPAEGVFH